MRNWPENQVILSIIRHGETKANQQGRYLGRTDEPLSREGREKLQAYQKQGRPLKAGKTYQEQGGSPKAGKTYQGQGGFPKAGQVFSSPMIRCLETAEILYPGLQPIVIPEWEEIDFGDFEYKNFQELQNSKAYQSWLASNGTLPFPRGESREDFCLRCRKGFWKMWQSLCSQRPAPQPAAPTSENRLCSQYPASQLTVSRKRLCSQHPALQSEMSETRLCNLRPASFLELPQIGLVVHSGTIMALLSQYAGGEYFDYQVPNGGGYLCRAEAKEGRLSLAVLQNIDTAHC